MTILVVGGRGHVGRSVVRGLLAAGEKVRTSSRGNHQQDWPPGVEAVRGDLTVPSTFPALLDGARKLFTYASAEHAPAFAESAKAAGVEHAVLLSSNSVLFPDAAANAVAVDHMRAERALQDAGLGWTFVRPGYLATNTYRWRRVIREERRVRGAFPDGSTPLVHEEDVAEVAVRALLDNSLRGTAPLVLGGASLTEQEQVATIAGALGEPVGYEVVSVEDYRRELSGQIPSFFVEAVIAAEGRVPQVPAEVRVDAVHHVLGRAPRTFAEWATLHAGDFR